MATHFGQLNPALTKVVNLIARSDTSCVSYTPHSFEEMDKDGFDQLDVLDCLRRGKAHGPEDISKGAVRANVIHRGLHIRVVIGGLDSVNGEWKDLESIVVITVMRHD